MASKYDLYSELLREHRAEYEELEKKRLLVEAVNKQVSVDTVIDEKGNEACPECGRWFKGGHYCNWCGQRLRSSETVRVR